MDLGEKIKYLRELKGVSQTKMAEDINVSRSMISNWESKRTSPTISQVSTIANYFNKSVSDFTALVEFEKTSEELLIEMLEVYYDTHNFDDNARMFRTLNELFVDHVEMKIKNK